MKIALVPLNSHVGHVSSNLEKITRFVDEAVKQDCRLIIFPELSLIGYPPKDLVFFESLFKQQTQAINKLKRLSKKIAILVGGYQKNPDKGPPFQNAAFFFQNGWKETYCKQLLPNYDVFDEKRYFGPGHEPFVFKMGRFQFGVTICEDIWAKDRKLVGRYDENPVEAYKARKIDYLINISSSPFEVGKAKRREALMKKVCQDCDSSVIYLNQSGANDDLIFDGGATLFDNKGKVLFRSRSFVEELLVVELSPRKEKAKPLTIEPILGEAESMHQALVLGVRDYVHKSGFKQVLLGLSGGMDSALVAQIAAEALGPENVLAVMLPSRYSSKGSIDDSKALIEKLGIASQRIEIDSLHKAFEKTFKKMFGRKQISDLTSQNIQARIRGNLLMAISNNSGRLLLNTTNKSEMAMGYGTLYGDMCGALAVISDLSKTQVYEVARAMNPKYEFIPKAIFTKEPSAELKPDQKDSDSLPEYDELDAFLMPFIDHFSFPESDSEIPRRVFANEYKRFQAPLGLKINEKAFGSGRRVPIVQKIST